MSKTTIAVVVVSLLLAGALIAFSLSGSEANNNKEAVNKTEWAKGKLDSKAVVEEFSDFQCPACKSSEDLIVKPLLQEYESKIKFVYKQYPLVSIHKYAQKASEASEAAGNQGKFWEMHDIMFQNQTESDDALSIDNLVKYASTIEGLDVNKFKQELEDSKYSGDVREDVDEGTSKGVDSTPSFFVNGKKIEGGTLDDIKNNLKVAIDEALSGS